jgi:ankyrin repeat protein
LTFNSEKADRFHCMNLSTGRAIAVAKVLSWLCAVALLCFGVEAASIHEAAERGDLAQVKSFLEKDPKQINSTDTKGRTALTCAASSGKKEIAEFLIEKGAVEDVFVAATLGHTNQLATLLQKDPKLANAKDSSGKAALHLAAMSGQRDAVASLLAAKADVNMVDDVGFTALHWAAMFNHSGVAQVLLANKADMNIKVPKFRWTPLRLTVIHGHIATAKVLFDAGANPNDRDEENVPLLIQAINRSNKEMVELLLAKKAEVNIKDWDGDSPLDEAIEMNNKEIIDLLRGHGAKGK